MWHGHACRLHAGTVAYLSGLGNDVLDDQPCVVRGYHGVNRGWIVKLQNPDFEGKAISPLPRNARDAPREQDPAPPHTSTSSSHPALTPRSLY